MAKVQDTVEDGLAELRGDLQKMEEDVDLLNNLLFQV